MSVCYGTKCNEISSDSPTVHCSPPSGIFDILVPKKKTVRFSSQNSTRLVPFFNRTSPSFLPSVEDVGRKLGDVSNTRTNDPQKAIVQPRLYMNITYTGGRVARPCLSWIPKMVNHTV
jgi:hypothetical protein